MAGFRIQSWLWGFGFFRLDGIGMRIAQIGTDLRTTRGSFFGFVCRILGVEWI
jgi:hypothetical protein